MRNHNKLGDDAIVPNSRLDLDDRLIKGMPIRYFIDEVKKQVKVREENEGTAEDYPIKIPGIGLHAIKEKQKVKEEKALGGKTKNPKFSYQKDIADHFMRDELRYKAREGKIFEKMEDLLDEEAIRQKID